MKIKEMQRIRGKQDWKRKVCEAASICTLMFVSISATSVSTTSHLGSDTIADRAAGGPLAQWLTVVALKVSCPLACRSMWPTNLTLSPCWEIDRKSEEWGKRRTRMLLWGMMVLDVKGDKCLEASQLISPPALLSSLNLPHGFKGWVTGLPAIIAFTAELP